MDSSIWKNNFDAIYCLSLADNKERREDCVSDFTRVGIMDSGIFHWKITVRNEFYKYIWTNPNLRAEPGWFNNTTALNCTMGHYEIIKECLAMGYEHVLILEDDCRFHKDSSVIETYLNNIPDYDICLFDKFIPIDKTPFNVAKETKRVNDYYFDFDTVKLWSCGCYALSRKGMDMLVKFQEYIYRPADHSINKVDNLGRVLTRDDLKRVASIENLAVQEMFGKKYASEQARLLDQKIYDGIADRKNYNVKL